MSHHCETCGETFETLTRLRLHDCEAELGRTQTQTSATDSTDTGRDSHDLDTRSFTGHHLASSALDTHIRGALEADSTDAMLMLARFERELRDLRATDTADYRTLADEYDKPVAVALDRVTATDGWSFLSEIVTAYPIENTDVPLVSSVIINAVARALIRTRLAESVAAIPPTALAYLHSVAGNQDIQASAWEDAMTYGWGLGHPVHDTSDGIQTSLREDETWARSALEHAFYADQSAAADLLATILQEATDHEAIGIAAAVSDVERDSLRPTPRYWTRDDGRIEFEWDEAVRNQLRTTIEDRGLTEQLPPDWTFQDLEPVWTFE
jgi:predicted  nucleic acid-binding Zn-ribbon protein